MGGAKSLTIENTMCSSKRRWKEEEPGRKGRDQGERGGTREEGEDQGGRDHGERGRDHRGREWEL